MEPRPQFELWAALTKEALLPELQSSFESEYEDHADGYALGYFRLRRDGKKVQSIVLRFDRIKESTPDFEGGPAATAKKLMNAWARQDMP